MRKPLVAALLCSGAVVGVSAGSASADHVPTHHHFLTTTNQKVVQVGPRVCANSNLYDAFHNFHNNVHAGAPTQTGGLSIAADLC